MLYPFDNISGIHGKKKNWLHFIISSETNNDNDRSNQSIFFFYCHENDSEDPKEAEELEFERIEDLKYLESILWSKNY